MALGEKYRVHVDHQFGGDSRYVRIFAEGYSGGVTELTGTGTPAILDYPGSDNAIFDPVFGSELSVNIWNLTADQFIEFASAKSLDYFAILYNDSIPVIEWQGWLLPSEQEEPWNQAPYETELIFNCGLGLLKDYDYLDTDGTYFTDRATLKDINIVDILSKLYPATVTGITFPGLLNAVSILETTLTLNVTNNCLANIYLNRNKYINDDGTVWNCLDVLRDVLTIYGARINMGINGWWWLVRLRDYSLFYDSYNIPYQFYNAAGSLISSGTLAPADYSATITGPQARSTMVGWVDGSQRVRYERAFKEIRLKQFHGYTNIVKAGDFFTEDWVDFWTINDTATRVQGADGQTYQVSIGTAASYIQQNFFIEGRGTAPEQRVTFSFEAMCDHDNAYTTLVFALEMFRDTGVVAQYLVGVVGGTGATVPGWQVGSGFVFFTNDIDIPASGEWQNYELQIPYFPSDVDCWFRLKHMGTAGAGVINGVFYRNVKMFGNYEGDPPDKLRELNLTISDQNTDIMPPKEFNVGDITLEGNEGSFFNAALTLDAQGAVPTIVWYSTRRDGANRLRVGPIQPILDYVKDGYAIQNGTIRKRLSGKLVLDNYRWITLVISEDSVLYAFTKLTIDLKRGECDVSMLELPAVEAVGDSFVLGWTNDGANGFDTFASTADLITSIIHTTGTPAYADSDDAISYLGYQQFLIKLEGTVVTGDLQVVFVGSTYAMFSDYEVVANAPLTPGSSTPRLQAAIASITAVSNITISITRIYGH